MRNKLITFCKRWTFVIVAGGVFGLNLVFWTRGDLWALLLGAGIAAWDTFLLATTALLAHILGARRFVRPCVIAINIAVIGIFVAIVSGYLLYIQDINAVKSYREPLVFSLEAYKNQHGRYPDRLSAIGNLAKNKPRLLDDTVLYYRSGDRFFLTFFDPDPLIRFWVYDSVEKRWRITN